jgi:GNAT superfamily N-acetyltransferase
VACLKSERAGVLLIRSSRGTPGIAILADFGIGAPVVPATDFVIRPPHHGDRAHWDPLWQGYLTFYKATLPSSITDLTWSRLLDPAEPMSAFVAARGDELIGLVHYLFHRSTWSQGHYCYLEDLFVAPDCRVRGVGRALIEAVEAEARRVNASRLYWMTHETNSRAQVLYNKVADRSGFIQYRKVL